MYIRQSALFNGVPMDFVKRAMDIAEKQAHVEGTTLFRDGDPAGSFYILIRGTIGLRTVGSETDTYIGDRVGEVFGWSGLVGRPVYTATAVCLSSSDLLKLDTEPFRNLLEQDTHIGFIVYRNLAELLGKRLIASYE